MKNRTQPTATIVKEVDITLGVNTFVVDFEIIARIDAGSKDTRDTPGEPPSVDEWVNLKLLKVDALMHYGDYSRSFIPTDVEKRLIEQHIQGLAEMNGMDWVDGFDDEDDYYDDDDYDRERE